MNRRIFLLLAVGLFGGAAGRAEVAAKPNVLFILADDLGWRDLSCYGSPFCETPNIDRLAAQGMKFTQAYSAGSVCSPTRSSIMTGKYPPRTGVTDYIPGLHPDGARLDTPFTARQLALEEVTIGEAFQAGGYQTFYAGKWHLGGKGFTPDAQGFEVCVGDGELGNHGKDHTVGLRISQAAIRFLADRDSARPFFMFLGYHEPHTPILDYPNHIDRFRTKASKLSTNDAGTIPEHDGLTRAAQDNPSYGSEVAGLDEWVGQVLTALDQQKLAETTIVVFFSDNGGLSTKAAPGPTCNAPLRAGKGWLYEGGIRVPLLIRAPGITRPGSVCAVPVISTDFFPTLLGLAGLPLRPEQHQDGVSLVPLLRDQPSVGRETLFWHYPHYHGSTWAPGAAVRDGDWKLIEFYHYAAVELYNLREDLGETNNLAQLNPGKTSELLAKLHAWQKSVNAQMPKPNSDVTPESKPARKKGRPGRDRPATGSRPALQTNPS